MRLDGVDGGNPLGFLAAIGLLRLLRSRQGRIMWAADSSNRLIVRGVHDIDGVGTLRAFHNDLLAVQENAAFKDHPVADFGRGCRRR